MRNAGALTRFNSGFYFVVIGAALLGLTALSASRTLLASAPAAQVSQKDQTYTAQDINDWIKGINNFLGQIVKKNPGLSLEEILQKQGLTQTQIGDFIEALQEAHYRADLMKGFGVSDETVKTLTALMKTLGVPTWTF